MSEKFNPSEAEHLLRNIEERALAIGEIYDDALESADLKTLVRVRNTYTREFLDQILGGYPEYLDEELGS